MKRKGKLTTPIAMAVLAVLVIAAAYAQEKYSLKSPSGITFSDFKGYEDWAVVSSARTDEVLKVIVANPAMIKAYKAGVPGKGQSFPDGSKIVKLQWKPKKSTEAPFVVDVPDVFSQAFVMEKDSKKFPKSGDGDTRCSTTRPHLTNSQPIPKASQTAVTPAMWPSRTRTISSTHIRSGENRAVRGLGTGCIAEFIETLATKRNGWPIRVGAGACFAA